MAQAIRTPAVPVNAAFTRSPVDAHEIAIHEAGHAALHIALDIDFVAVSIIPDFHRGSLGAVFPKLDAIAGQHVGVREAFYLRYAMVYYAGAEAVRQLIPTHPNPDSGASRDKRRAGQVIIEHIGGDEAALDLLFSLAERRCALLVTHYQPEIQALAAALETRRILRAKSARQVCSASLLGKCS